MKLINTDSYTLESRLQRLASGRRRRRLNRHAPGANPGDNSPRGTTPKKAA
ncbi:MAG TPA: hypothetical protein VHP13_07690 [Gammaproteobacteria bacterium]|jgi:hypothetical protein|nr:hypothetical protein [Gammaproteobacteria bacterium]